MGQAAAFVTALSWRSPIFLVACTDFLDLPVEFMMVGLVLERRQFFTSGGCVIGRYWPIFPAGLA
jgi:hypothetical protein